MSSTWRHITASVGGTAATGYAGEAGPGARDGIAGPRAGRSGGRFPAAAADLLQRDREVGDEQQVVVAQDDFHLGTGLV